MKKIVLSLLMSVGLMAGDEFYAQEEIRKLPMYVGVGLTAQETFSKNSDQSFYGHSSGEFSSAGFVLNAGYLVYTRNEASVVADVKISSSTWMEDSESFTTQTAGVYTKLGYSPDKAIDIYGLIGVNSINWSGDYEDVTATGPSIGVGIGLNTARNVTIFAEYILTNTDAYLEYLDDEVNYSTFNVGILYRFDGGI